MPHIQPLDDRVHRLTVRGAMRSRSLPRSDDWSSIAPIL